MTEFTAAEARKNLKFSYENHLAKVLRDIEVNSYFRTTTSYTVPDAENTTDIYNYLITELSKKGFKVKREHGYDQRERTEWDYLVISW